MDEREELDRLRKLKRVRELEAIASGAAPSSQQSAQPTRQDQDDGLSIGGVVGGGVDTALRGLDYLGGLSRTAIATAADPFTEKDLTTVEDLYSALKGKAPSSSEILGRAGMEEGIGRSVLGFGLDVASDPLTYASFGLSAISKGKSVAKPLSKLLKAAGLVDKGGDLTRAGSVANKALNPLEMFHGKKSEKLYKKAFSNIDFEAKTAGKKLMPSKVLHDAGFIGQHAAAADELKRINSLAGEIGGAARKEASEMGAVVNLKNIAKDLTDDVAKLRSGLNPEDAKVADDIVERLNYAIGQTGDGKVSVEFLNQAKSKLDSMLTWAENTKTPINKEAIKKITNMYRRRIEQSVEGVSESLAKTLKEQNLIYSATDAKIVNAAKKIGKSVVEKRNPFNPIQTQVDAGLAIGALQQAYSGNPTTALTFASLLGGKGAFRAGTSTTGRTARAALAKKLGQSVIPDAAARRSAWSILNDQEDPNQLPAPYR